MSFLKISAATILCCFSLHGIERHADLSYAKQTIQVLPEIQIKESAPVKGLIFLHIPKTAGTNIENIAKSLSQHLGTFHHQRLPVPLSPNVPPTIITEGWVGGLEALNYPGHSLNTLPESFFLTGHFPYGLHQSIQHPAKYVTLIRNPLERELSSINFSYQRGHIEAENFISLLLNRSIDNPQVRLIAGKDHMFGICNEETFHKALLHLKRDFLLVAPSEEVDSFIQVLAALQHWGPIAYAPMQITQQKIVNNLDPAIIDILLQKHQWDVKLYQEVKNFWILFKDEMVLEEKKLELGDLIFTLMPDHLNTKQFELRTLQEIHDWNETHSGQDPLMLKQKIIKILKSE